MDKFIAHILVVDDDDGIRSLVKKYLNENSFLVTTADCAEDAGVSPPVLDTPSRGISRRYVMYLP